MPTSLFYKLVKAYKPLLTLFFILFLGDASAQTQTQLDAANRGRIDITRKGMWVLGGWAVANMAYGGYKTTRTTGQEKYFHQMNMLWNTVNLGLAASSLLTTDFETLNLQKTIAQQHKMEKILLLNIGLDAAYIATGFFLKEKGKTAAKTPERWAGYGNSLLLQGGFLLAFDGVLYYTLQKHGNKTLQLLDNVQLGFNQIGYTWTF